MCVWSSIKFRVVKPLIFVIAIHNPKFNRRLHTFFGSGQSLKMFFHQDQFHIIHFDLTTN